MYNLVRNYVNNLTKEQVLDFARQNNIQLSDQELDFTYNFVKKNWETVFRNPNLLNFERFKNQFSEENFVKIKNLFQFYYQKYGYLL